MKKHLSRLAAVCLTLTLLVTHAFALTVEQALELLEENYYCCTLYPCDPPEFCI